MTVVGVEKLQRGGFNLIVFDPKYYDTDKWDLAMERSLLGKGVDDFLALYRRGIPDLRKYSEFEILECV